MLDWFRRLFGRRRATIGGLDRVILPIIRRVRTELVAYDLAGVQPMDGSAGQIFTVGSTLVGPPPLEEVEETDDY